MKSFPYENVSDEVKEVVSGLLQGADDYHRGHKARLARSVQLIVDSKPEGRILEIGTTGFIPLALKALLPDVTVDVTHFDRSMPSVFFKTVEINQKKMTVNAMSVDLENRPIPADNNTYDYVVCCEVLEHMEIDPMFMLQEINRVTRYDGSLFLTTPNVASSRGLHKIVRGLEPYFFMAYHKTREYHRHNYEYTALSLEALLKYAGYHGRVWTEDLFEDAVPDTVDRLTAAGFDIKNTGDNIIAQVKKHSDVVERFPVGFYV